jgi:hypothetical protein
MASYAELRGLIGEDVYQKKIEAACVDAAYLVLAEDDGTANHAARIALAFKIIEEPIKFGAYFARVILLKNKAATVAQITGANDATALGEVQAVYNEFAAHYGV